MGKVILVVDDEPDIALSLKVTFKDSDYEIQHVENGEQCFEFLEKSNKNPDLILLDIMMPGLSGWEVYDAIRQNQAWRHIPIVFFSGISDNITKNIDGIIGDGFIQKPIEPEKLIHQIENILNKNN